VHLKDVGQDPSISVHYEFFFLKKKFLNIYFLYYYSPICFYISKAFLKKFEIFLFFSLLQINIFLVFSNHFDVLMSKIIFLKNHYFDAFPSKKHFEK
jgi:hypothetical protein